MKRRLLALWLLASSLWACGSWFDGLWFPGTGRNRLARGVAQGPGTLIRLDEITPFEYKTAHIFGPYTTIATIQSRLVIDADEAERLSRGIEGRDDIHLLVFSFEHVSSKSMEIPRSQAGFGLELAECSFIAQEAVFVVKKGGTLGLAPGVSCK
jgi:hypothetical protein